MGNFQGGGNRGGGFRGGNGGGGRPSFGGNRGGDRGPVTMHKAVCDECHKNCEVPFRPSGDKPIYCNECFGSKRGDVAPRREFRNDRPAPTFSKPAVAPMGNDMSKQLSEMNNKLDRLINSIEKLAQPKAIVTPVITKPVVKVAQKKVVLKIPAKKVVVKKGKK